MKVLRFGYVVTLHGTATNGVVMLEGETDGGVYTYKATATPTNFQSTYDCKYDHGRYEMMRPGQ